MKETNSFSGCRCNINLCSHVDFVSIPFKNRFLCSCSHDFKTKQKSLNKCSIFNCFQFFISLC
ncbi:hypothetical protein RchiOBHm_Chr3g0475601 [Rosa chinensis]|uniref:Uncharacterized protein n=1 Tax=Rosa chinensis TaxID=74649 RepID=A0A2P6RCH1_ROSCH|nr:hypothetical protein RchiOBHm_Chr3g0475601 [Rosa chinensis]